MAVKLDCQLCRDQLDPAQSLRFLVETENLNDPAYLKHIRQLPAVHGRPMRVCKTCQTSIEKRPHRAAPVSGGRKEFRSTMLAAFGVFAVGWVFGVVLGE